MKKMLLGLALLGACAPQPPREEAPARDHEMAVLLAMAYDPAQLRVGQWALYMVRRQGDPTSSALKLQVVGQEADGSCWVELKLPAEPKAMVIKSRLDRSGKLHEQWVGEAGSKGPARTYPRLGDDGKPVQPPTPKPLEGRPDVQISDETLKAGGRAYLCKKIATTLAYAGGKSTTLVNWCHPDVPFSFTLGTESMGGVVRREYGKYTLDLADCGQTGARSELEIPR